MAKPIVHYEQVPGFTRKQLEIGRSAMVAPLDHTSPNVSNQGIARTSPVVALHELGFETQNTIYVIAPPEQVTANLIDTVIGMPIPVKTGVLKKT